MKTSLLLVFLLTTGLQNAYAAATVHFFGIQTMINIAPQHGITDADAQTLYDAMNVEIQNSFLGLGKSITTSQQELNFICAIRNNVNYQCSIYVKNSPYAEIDPASKRLLFRATGADAQQFIEKWHLQNDEFHFLSSDRKFKLTVQPDLFEFEFSNSGSL